MFLFFKRNINIFFCQKYSYDKSQPLFSSCYVYLLLKARQKSDDSISRFGKMPWKLCFTLRFLSAVKSFRLPFFSAIFCAHALLPKTRTRVFSFAVVIFLQCNLIPKVGCTWLRMPGCLTWITERYFVQRTGLDTFLGKKLGYFLRNLFHIAW